MSKLLKVGGFDPAGKAKSFSVDHNGFVNVTGSVSEAYLGDYIEPHSENYQGVLAAFGHKVYAGAQLNVEKVLGGSGNYVVFTAGSGDVDVTITNLNLQPLASYTLANVAKLLLKEGRLFTVVGTTLAEVDILTGGVITSFGTVLGSVLGPERIDTNGNEIAVMRGSNQVEILDINTGDSIVAYDLDAITTADFDSTYSSLFDISLTDGALTASGKLAVGGDTIISVDRETNEATFVRGGRAANSSIKNAAWNVVRLYRLGEILVLDRANPDAGYKTIALSDEDEFFAEYPSALIGDLLLVSGRSGRSWLVNLRTGRASQIDAQVSRKYALAADSLGRLVAAGGGGAMIASTHLQLKGYTFAGEQ